MKPYRKEIEDLHRSLVSEGADPDEARQKIVAMILTGELGLQESIVKQAVGSATRRRPERKAPVKEHGKSWREKLTTGAIDQWSIEIPTASGATKKLADLTRNDVLGLARWYRGAAAKAVFRAESLERVARQMGPTETLREAVSSGRVQMDRATALAERRLAG